jgi:hypothetical protein
MFNPCRERGCQAACCRNIKAHAAVSESFFKKAFPTAIKVNSEDDLVDNIRHRKGRVEYTIDRGWVYYSISGDCPHLDPNLGCDIHETSFYPKPCTNMEIGKRGCRESMQTFNINQLLQKRT